MYDYWNHEYVGEVEQGFPIFLRPCASKVFSVRKKLGRPQIVSTSRHLSQGGFDLLSVAWDAKRGYCLGVSRVVSADPYELVVYVPEGLRIFVEGNAYPFTESAPGGKECLVDVFPYPPLRARCAWSIAFTPSFPHLA